MLGSTGAENIVTDDFLASAWQHAEGAAGQKYAVAAYGRTV